MKVMDIKVCLMVAYFFTFLGLVSAVAFDFNAPDNVNLNENFTVSITFNEASDEYDVKIFSEDEIFNTTSQVYYFGWKNPKYYLRSAFPRYKEFINRVTSGLGKQRLCVRLRVPERSDYDEKCKDLAVLDKEEIESFGLEDSNIEGNIIADEKIVLNTPVPETYETKDNKTRNYVIFSVIGVLVLIILFFAIRKI